MSLAMSDVCDELIRHIQEVRVLKERKANIEREKKAIRVEKAAIRVEKIEVEKEAIRVEKEAITVENEAIRVEKERIEEEEMNHLKSLYEKAIKEAKLTEEADNKIEEEKK